MFVVRNYVTMFGTAICALGIGFLMQNGSLARGDRTQAAVDVASTDGQASVLAGLKSITLTSSSPSDVPIDTAPSAQRTLRAEPSASTTPKSCNLSARASAVQGAKAHLSIKAPCHANERVEIYHSGLIITQVTDTNGAVDLTVPALTEYAIFLISFQDETGSVATTHISDIDQYHRVALQWSGATNLQIHALEFEASYGGDGHVWSGQSAQGIGNVVNLGRVGFEDAQNVEVYSFPAGQNDRSGSIALTVEAEVTDANCGQTLSVQSLELRSDRRLRSRDLTLSLPDCSHTGEFLVLNNLLEDLTIAAK